MLIFDAPEIPTDTEFDFNDNARIEYGPMKVNCYKCKKSAYVVFDKSWVLSSNPFKYVKHNCNEVIKIDMGTI